MSQEIEYKSKNGFNGILKIGDRIRIKGLEEGFEGELKATIIAFDLKDRVWPIGVSWPYIDGMDFATIDESDLRYFSIDEKYLGDHIIWISKNNSSNGIGLILEKLTVKPIKEIILDNEMLSYRDFFYGESIKREEESLPPIEKRAFEFL